MCGIAGFLGKEASLKACLMLETIRHRGPDGEAILEEGMACLGHAHLKITGDCPQPVKIGDLAFVYNGEIYNYRDFSPASASDTGALAELLKGGISGFLENAPSIDGEYAFAAWDGRQVMLFRDPAGIRPLYYGRSDDGLGFASERKGLVSAGIRDVRSLAPGCMYIDGEERRFADLPQMRQDVTDEREAVQLLDAALKKAVMLRLHEDAAVTFSGGVDSALIAAMAPEAPLVTTGMAGSFDVTAARNAAKLMSASGRHVVYEFGEKDVEEALPGLIYAIESADPVKVAIALPLYILARKARDDGYRVLLSGQGSDELFAGYARYEAAFREDRLQQALDHDQHGFASTNLERDDAAAMASGVELRVPYLAFDVLRLARRIDPSLKLQFNGKDYIRKYVLRKVAEMYLPREVSSAPKKAIQYGTGVQKAIEKIARRHGRDQSAYLQTLYEDVLA